MTLCRKLRYGSPLRAGLLVIFAIVLVSSFAVAQNDSTPKWNVFVGYQWLHPGATVPAAFGDPNNPVPYNIPDMAKGFGSAVTYNFDSHWGGELDLGHNWGNSNYETTVSGGPQFMWRTDDANYFLHAMLGYNRLNVNGLTGNNGIGVILGGGLDLPFTKKIAWRVFEADYVWARHNYADEVSPSFPDLRRPSLEGVRLRTGLVFSWGGAEEIPPTASCSVQPAEVVVGEPITATVTTNNFNPKHTVTYSWSGNGGGQVTGKDTTASIDTTNAAPGNYPVTAHVTDPKSKKNNEVSCTANYTVKPLPPKNPPTMSLSASPSELVTGGNVNLSANCSSPDDVPVSVANWQTTAGTISGTGTSVTLNTSGVAAGPVTVTATCTDSRGLAGQATTQVTLQNPPPPPVNKEVEARLALHSIYFPTALPAQKEPNGGLIVSQEKTLQALASDFKSYLVSKPDARLVLEGHADIRGSDAYNQALSERRVARVRSYLREQGVPDSALETKAYGKQRNLTLQEVKDSIAKNPDLTQEERKRALARIQVIKLASNRRVDVTLSSAGATETSVRQFPFNAADALTLIGGREREMKKPAKAAPRKKPVKKP